MINLIYLTNNLKQYNINKQAVSLCWDTDKQKLFVLQNKKQYQILHSIDNIPGINNCKCDLSSYALKSDLKPHLDNVSFSAETKQLIFTFKLNENVYKSNVSLKDLCMALSAGKNIKIEDNVISFDGQIPQFTAGNYIEITDDDIINVKFKQLLQNLNITSNTLNVSRNDNDINIELELKGGKDISIENNVISYTGQDYKAGEYIEISSNKSISVKSDQILNNLNIASNTIDVIRNNNDINIELNLKSGKDISIENNVINYIGQTSEYKPGEYIEITDDDIINVKSDQILNNLNIKSNTIDVIRNGNNINLEFFETKYEAGKNIKIENDIISFDGQGIKYIAGKGIDIDQQIISVSYTAGNGISIENNKISSLYTAGKDISIENNVISYTGKELIGGKDITISDNVISYTGKDYVAGKDISIIDNIISYTGQTTEYIAGNGISIDNNKISSLYTAGKDISIENNKISFTGQIPEYIAGKDISIIDNVINYTGKQYIAGYGIAIDNKVISLSKQIPEYTAGKDISIEDNVISYTGQSTEYTAGKDISIENNVISYTGQTTEYTAGSCISIKDNKISVNSTQVLNNLSINSNSLDVTRADNAISIESRKLKLSDFIKIIENESQLDNASDQFLYVILEK